MEYTTSKSCLCWDINDLVGGNINMQEEDIVSAMKQLISHLQDSLGYKIVQPKKMQHYNLHIKSEFGIINDEDLVNKLKYFLGEDINLSIRSNTYYTYKED